MHHHQFTVSDLLKDESFINFCRRQNERDILYWEKYITDHPEKKPIIDEAIQEHAILFTTLANADLEEQMQKLRMKIEAADAAPVVTMRKTGSHFKKSFRYAAAVAILLLVAAAIYLNKKPNETVQVESPTTEYASKPGERKSFQLPDGTQVSLNAGSSVTISNSYGATTREVTLKGEAFFEVQHNKQVPFIVHAADMDVKALGTAFNVRSYQGERSEAALLHGLVEVTLIKDNNRKILLHPDQKISLTSTGNIYAQAPKNNPLPQKENDEKSLVKLVKKLDDGSVKEVAWMENKLVFENDPFEDIVPQLARWYDVEISFASEEVKRYHFTATFKKEKLEQVLNILRTTKAFKYRKEGKTIIIEK